MLLHGLCIAVRATRALGTGIALVETEEDVVLVERVHGVRGETERGEGSMTTGMGEQRGASVVGRL
jgi:hypothetical protein